MNGLKCKSKKVLKYFYLLIVRTQFVIFRRLCRIRMIFFGFCGAIVRLAIEGDLFHLSFNFRQDIRTNVFRLPLDAAYARRANHRRSVTCARRYHVIALVLVQVISRVPGPQIGMFIHPLARL